MPAAWPAFVSIDFEIAEAEPSGCRDEIPFLKAGTTEDTEVFVGTAASQNSGAGIPSLDKNRSILALEVDETVGVRAEERSFEDLDMFRIGRRLENEDEPPCLRTVSIYSLGQSSLRDKDRDLDKQHTADLAVLSHAG